MGPYLVGVDIGGTFTDCVVLDRDGRITATKSPSTPGNFADGMLGAMGVAAERLGLAFPEFCAQIKVLTHGTTVGTNSLIQRKGAKVGLITTRGHEDAIHIMRGSRGVNSRDIAKVVHYPESQKPDPIVPKRRIRGISERVDCFGEVVVPMDEAEVEAAARSLVADGCTAIAICFLWSFRHDAHERRAREIVRRVAPDVFVSCSVDIAPKWGEYERTAATVLNAYIGPVMSRYLSNLSEELRRNHYRQPLQIAQCGGGSVSLERAMESPLLTLDSGPVAGVTGSQYFGRLIGTKNVITTDMGGTSFDVGIIADGEPEYTFISNVIQYDYFLPKIDIEAIGAGGGSLASVDAFSGGLRVGPQSAGADPGPACYGKGNTTPTVTDADVVLGYIDPDNFLGGRIRLDRSRSVAAVQSVADQLGLPLMEAASGIAKIAEFKMADIIRKMTVEKGHDPRDFTLFAFGGAGPVHASVFGAELGVQKVIVPLREIASTWCAFGAASADILHVYEQVDIQGSPFDPGRINAVLDALREKADAQLARDGVPASRRRFTCALDMRHRGQINEVECVLATRSLRPSMLPALREQFFTRYEQLYGRNAAFREARLEIVTLRVRGTAVTPRPALPKAERLSSRVPKAARRPSRPVWWDGLKSRVDTPIYDGARLLPGNRVAGPCVVETAQTNVVVHPGRALRVDAWGNFEITFQETR
ncbi:MAG: hydantoinase/oxoprolinase family protein [Betaproteobacteria bacterium]|nr:hydantoinase/oxoprolinase family protein [Betaproteobacteria bacterium]